MQNLLDQTSKTKCTSYRIAVLLFAVFVISPCLLITILKQARADHTSHNVLILNSYHKEFTWTDNQVSAAKEVLEKAFDDLEIHVEYMDTKRIYTNEYLEYLSHIFRLKYANVKLDAIITTDDNALRFVMQYHKDIFGETPVTFCGINDYNDALLKGREQFTGLIEVLDITPTIDLALKLHPGTRKVIVVVDSTPTGLGQRKAVADASRRYKHLEFEYLEGKHLTNDELLEKLRILPKDSICLLTVWLRDKNNEYLSSVMGGKLISSNSVVPVYGIIDMYYGQGIVGGKLLNSATHGRIAAEFAVRIMKGEKPSAMPVLVESTNPCMFDYTQLERWGISKSALPTGSIFINEPFSFYKTYKKLIWFVILSFATLVLFISVLFFNIIRRKQSEDALASQTELLNNILNNVPHNVFWKDRQFVYLGCNKAFAEVTGLGKPENIIGKTDYDLPWKKEETDSYRQCDKNVMDTGIPMFDIEEPLTQADGQEKTIITSKVPLFDKNRNVFGILGIYYDITDRKQMEETAKQTQKMEAIGTLAGGIAHDFNNILGGIIGYTELAQDDTAQGSPVQNYLEEVIKSSIRARDLVRQILTFSRKSQEERKPIQFSTIVKEAAKLLRSTIPTTIEIRQNIDDTTGMVNADPTQMHQIVMNLCTNAAHAMQETGGVLEIAFSPVVITQESMSKYHDVSPGPFVELKISDTGTGIDPGIIHRIFDPFFTTKAKGKGTGMGLAVVHGIVKDHGGDISVDSQLDKGTTFTILLPQVIAEPGKEEATRSEVPTGNDHILFVDDEKMLMNVGEKILGSLGYKVTALNSSLEALETFQQDPDSFDLVISDQTMPHMTGFDLAKRILEIKPAVPVILCTGYSDTVSPEKAVAAGIKTLIYKPISKKEIAKEIRGVLKKKES